MGLPRRPLFRGGHTREGHTGLKVVSPEEGPLTDGLDKKVPSSPRRSGRAETNNNAKTVYTHLNIP